MILEISLAEQGLSYIDNLKKERCSLVHEGLCGNGSEMKTERRGDLLSGWV